MSLIFQGNAKERHDHASNIVGAFDKWEGLINASTLKKDDFEGMRDEIKRIQELNLVAAQDLITKGLTFDETVMHTVVTVHNELDMSDAKRSINPTQLTGDQSGFGLTSVPLPIIHKTFEIPWRQEGFNYKQSTGFGRTMRKIMESSNDLVVNGDTSIQININGANQPIYGYTSHPNAASVTITDWAAATTSILSDVQKLWNAMFTTNKVPPRAGSLTMYVPTDYYSVLRNQAFANKGELTFEQQILRDYPEIEAIKPDPSLATQNVVLVAMMPEYVQLAVAQSPIIVPHVKEVSIMPQFFTGYAVWTPFIHVDANNKTGVVHGSV